MITPLEIKACIHPHARLEREVKLTVLRAGFVILSRFCLGAVMSPRITPLGHTRCYVTRVRRKLLERLVE